LNQTGMISVDIRLAVASFLVDELEVNWQMGAEYFESTLLDYDPCSNYGNWNYIARLSNDTKEPRHYDPLSRAIKLDPDATYVRRWCPALKSLPDEYCLQPFNLSEDQQRDLDFILGRDFPKICITLN